MSRQGNAVAMANGAARARIEESQRFSARIGPVIGALYFVFFLLFAYLAVWPLVATYLACLLFDLWVYTVTRRCPDRLNPLLAWVWIVVFVQSLFAVWVLGPDAGFQYYLLATIPIAFSQVDRSLPGKLLQTGLIIAFFLICDSWLLRYAVPLYPYSEPVLATLRHVNTIGTCTMLAAGAYVQSLVIKESADALRRIAATDTLTGLLNRRSFGEIAEREVARCQRSGSPLSLALGDIDFFKRINDAHGHSAGDHVLQVVANLLPGALREYDCVARWGGEEFIVLFPDTGSDQALGIAERLRERVAASHPQYEGAVIPVSMTLGVAQFVAGDNWHAVVARADEALYRGKSAGRNRVEAG